MIGKMSGIETHSTLEGFFEELLREAMAVEHVDLEHESFVYVTGLFADFAKPGGLHRCQRAGERGTPALAWLYEDAANARDPGERFNAYRHLGDVSLIVSGFFTPHVQRERSVVGLEYYVDMGMAAYDAASTLAIKSGFSRLLNELALKFSRLVDVLSRVAERTTLPVARDLEALYERLMNAPESRHAYEKLLEQGAVPVFAAAEAKA